LNASLPLPSSMKKILFDCESVKDPYEFLREALEIEPMDKAQLKRRILGFRTPAIVEVEHRFEGVKRWSEFINFLEEVSQKNRFLYIVWGPKKVENLIAEEQMGQVLKPG